MKYLYKRIKSLMVLNFINRCVRISQILLIVPYWWMIYVEVLKKRKLNDISSTKLWRLQDLISSTCDALHIRKPWMQDDIIFYNVTWQMLSHSFLSKRVLSVSMDASNATGNQKALCPRGSRHQQQWLPESHRLKIAISFVIKVFNREWQKWTRNGRSVFAVIFEAKSRPLTWHWTTLKTDGSLFFQSTFSLYIYIYNRWRVIMRSFT